MQQTRFVPLVSLICIATVMFIFWTSRVLSKCSQRSTLVMVREPGKVREQRIAARETVSDSLEESQCFSVWELLNSEYELMHIPSFSYDESIYIFSTAMSVREQSVYIMLPNPATEEWPMKHNFKSQFSCSFGPVSQAGNYTPAQIVDEVDGHYYVLICRIPQPLLECVIQRSGVHQASETYIAMCLIVNLHISSNVSRKEPRVPPLIARFKVCQPKQHRRDYLALCAQPVTSRIWPIIPQWLEYNLMVGVEHFYLYSATGTREGLQHAVRPYFDSSQVTFKSWMAQHWPGRRTIFRQIVAQCDCLYSLKDHAKWILFVDVDEYVLPAPQFRDVKSFLRNFTKFAAISMKSFNYQYPPQHGNDKQYFTQELFLPAK
eukprot:scpid64562/ scgid3047/ 